MKDLTDIDASKRYLSIFAHFKKPLGFVDARSSRFLPAGGALC